MTAVCEHIHKVSHCSGLLLPKLGHDLTCFISYGAAFLVHKTMAFGSKLDLSASSGLISRTAPIVLSRVAVALRDSRALVFDIDRLTSNLESKLSVLLSFLGLTTAVCTDIYQYKLSM